jgi:hypothetical protein
MTSTRIYLLDANVLMTAARFYYAFDLLPNFWSVLNSLAQNGSICSIDRVHEEINKGNDELVSWVNGTFLDYFFKTDTPVVMQAYADIIRWSQGQRHYNQAVLEAFARYDHGDTWLVAYAKAHQVAIVTLESANPATKKKIPLPIVCEAFGVPWINTFDMLRESQIRLR